MREGDDAKEEKGHRVLNGENCAGEETERRVRKSGRDERGQFAVEDSLRPVVPFVAVIISETVLPPNFLVLSYLEIIEGYFFFTCPCESAARERAILLVAVRYAILLVRSDLGE